MSAPLYALTLWRPWDWAILRAPPELAKRVENRDWPPPVWLHGRYIAIHAGKTYDNDGRVFIETQGLHPPPRDASPSGAIVGVVRIARSIRLAYDQGEESGIPQAQERWAFGPWCWCLDDVRAVDPVSCRGDQKLWPVPEDVAAEVRRRWKAAAG